MESETPSFFPAFNLFMGPKSQCFLAKASFEYLLQELEAKSRAGRFEKLAVQSEKEHI
jgi:hypothetical protein